MNEFMQGWKVGQAITDPVIQAMKQQKTDALYNKMMNDRLNKNLATAPRAAAVDTELTAEMAKIHGKPFTNNFTGGKEGTMNHLAFETAVKKLDSGDELTPYQRESLDIRRELYQDRKDAAIARQAELAERQLTREEAKRNSDNLKYEAIRSKMERDYLKAKTPEEKALISQSIIAAGKTAAEAGLDPRPYNPMEFLSDEAKEELLESTKSQHRHSYRNVFNERMKPVDFKNNQALTTQDPSPVLPQVIGRAPAGVEGKIINQNGVRVRIINGIPVPVN